MTFVSPKALGLHHSTLANHLPKQEARNILSLSLSLSISEKLLNDQCYRVCPPQIYILKLNPQYVVVGYGAFGVWSGHENRTLMNEISILNKRPQNAPLPFLSCEYTTTTWPFMNQWVSSHHTPNLPAPSSWTSQPPELWEINICCL